MNFDNMTILETQHKTGFEALYLEKVLRLMDILNVFYQDEVLKDKYALKGGTALNLFHFKIPRLSVDIDLNYIGLDRATMQKDREQHEKHLANTLSKMGYSLKRIPDKHAGGKWRMGYNSVSKTLQNIEFDLNYMHRIPLLPLEIKDSYPLGDFKSNGITVLNINELAAGKFCALLSRTKSRDLFDAYELLCSDKLDKKSLRACFVVYAGFNKADFSKINSFEPMPLEPQQFRQELIDMLPADTAPSAQEQEAYTKNLTEVCKEKISMILPFTENEQQFLHNVNRKGIIKPELLNVSDEMRDKIQKHPMLQWKVLNVRKHYGLDISG